MKLSASLYSNKNSSITDTIHELENYCLDYWHIDSIENKAVFKDIQMMNQISQTPIDLHIISKNPSEFYTEIDSHRIDRVSFQIEELSDDFQFPKFKDTKVGLAIQIHHPDIESKINQYKHEIDFVLLMMTTPGISGGKFKKTFFSDIRHLTTQFSGMHWCIDGGVNHEISYILRLIGIQSVVVGSYLMHHENMAQAILNIRSNRVKSDYRVSDFQIPISELPIISLKDSVQSTLSKMNDYKLGIVFCIDNQTKLLGIISNADVRKVILLGHFSYDMSIEAFVNTNPKTIYDDQSTAEMIDLIDKTPFPILVLPIITKNGTLNGAISFHKLLKEE